METATIPVKLRDSRGGKITVGGQTIGGEAYVFVEHTPEVARGLRGKILVKGTGLKPAPPAAEPAAEEVTEQPAAREAVKTEPAKTAPKVAKK